MTHYPADVLEALADLLRLLAGLGLALILAYAFVSVRFIRWLRDQIDP